MEIKRRVRRRGFSCPLNPYQIVSWIVTILTLTGVSIIFARYTEGYILASIYYLFQTVAIILAALIIGNDPSDRFTLENISELSSIGYCSICGTNVYPSSKHCGNCNRCVMKFDHHCKVLNNCIGAVNYKLFFSLIISVLLQGIALAIYSSFMLYICISTGDKSYSIISALLLGESVGVCIGDGYLISLHTYLQIRGITTYEYIIENRNKLEAMNIANGESKDISTIDSKKNNQINLHKTVPNDNTFDAA